MSVKECERCGSLNGLSVDGSFPRVEIPDEYDYLCRHCAEKVNTHTVGDMSDDALIASIVDDSMGYADPHHAAQHVEAFHEGERYAYCERAVSCFPMDESDVPDDDRMVLSGKPPGDLNRLIERARANWCAMDQEKRDELLEFVEAWREREDPGEISSIGLMYPTHGP